MMQPLARYSEIWFGPGVIRVSPCHSDTELPVGTVEHFVKVSLARAACTASGQTSTQWRDLGHFRDF